MSPATVLQDGLDLAPDLATVRTDRRFLPPCVALLSSHPSTRFLLLLPVSSLFPPSFFPVPGLGPLPFHFAQSLLTTERLSGSGLHWPLSRTRSEPLPPSMERLKPHVQGIEVRGTESEWGAWGGLPSPSVLKAETLRDRREGHPRSLKAEGPLPVLSLPAVPSSTACHRAFLLPEAGQSQ